MVDSIQRARNVFITKMLALTALAFVGTLVIRIPIPATTGYFNLGDVFVVLAGLWLGPKGGLIVGAVGPTLADAIGFPVFIPATLVTKGLEGFVVGLIGGARVGKPLPSAGRALLGAYAGGSLVVVGYFVFEAYIYPMIGTAVPAFNVTDWNAAVVEIGPNCVQWLIGATVGTGLWRGVAGTSASVKPKKPS